MVNAMSGEGDSQPVTDPRLVPEVLNMIDEESVGDYWEEEDEWILPARLSETELRELLIERRLSEDDVDFNLKVLRIRNIAFHDSDLVRLVEKEYECGIIMALSLALKEVERCLEEIGQLYGRVSHAQDKDALAELCNLLEWYAGDVYWDDLLREARRVGAAYSEPHIPYEGRWYGGIDYELIEARFALDAIWDGEASKKHGATEQNRQLAKRRAPELDTSPKVVKARRSLRIPRGGFKDVEAAFQWSQKWSPDWSRRDDAYWQEVVWWESFTWVPYLERVMGRGYIMLDLPAMNQAVQDLVDGYDDLGRAWYRALPLYLIRGRLEPPPRILHQPWRERQKHEEIFQLWKKHQHDFKVVVSYNYGLTDADWEEIAEKEPAARLQYIRANAQATIQEAAFEIGDRKGTLRDEEEEWISEDYVRKLRSRKGVAKR